MGLTQCLFRVLLHLGWEGVGISIPPRKGKDMGPPGSIGILKFCFLTTTVPGTLLEPLPQGRAPGSFPLLQGFSFLLLASQPLVLPLGLAHSTSQAWWGGLSHAPPNRQGSLKQTVQGPRDNGPVNFGYQRSSYRPVSGDTGQELGASPSPAGQGVQWRAQKQESDLGWVIRGSGY